jgi:ferredoxin
MKVKVDLNKCKAEGRCYEIATEVFQRGSDGKSMVALANISDDDTDLLMQAESAQMMCPSAAISIDED